MKPIIKSVLDLDRYKLTMSQFIYFHYRDVLVEFELTIRTKDENARIILLDLIPVIKEQVKMTGRLRTTFSELLYLQETKIFKEKYLNFLNAVNLWGTAAGVDTIEVGEKEIDGVKHLNIKYRGSWAEKTLWETYCLSIVSELYSRQVAKIKYCKDNKLSDTETYKIYHNHNIFDEPGLSDKILLPYRIEALKRLDEKIEIYKHHPQVKFFEFGTRRRFSANLQEQVVLKLQESFHKPQFLGTSQFMGTSNEYLAFKYKGIKAGGTSAHEMDMGIVALHNDDEKQMVESVWEWRRKWAEFYGYDLSVCLTDTFGSEWYFKNCPEDIAHMYSVREDSAVNLFEYTDRYLELCKKFKIHSNDKVLVHSNGLTALKIVNIANYKPNEINKVYGQGTDLSCDVGNDYKHLSIVIKLTKVFVNGNWIDTVKLSDNLAKAIGPKDQIERYKRIFGYTNQLSETQIY